MSEAPDSTAYADIVVVMQAYERMKIIQDKTANIAAQLNALAEQQRKLYEENDVLATEHKEMRKLLDQMRKKYGDPQVSALPTRHATNAPGPSA